MDFFESSVTTFEEKYDHEGGGTEMIDDFTARFVELGVDGGVARGLLKQLAGISFVSGQASSADRFNNVLEALISEVTE